jgi:hypothetical protein
LGGRRHRMTAAARFEPQAELNPSF